MRSKALIFLCVLCALVLLVYSDAEAEKKTDAPNESTNIDDAKYRGGGGGYGGGGWGGGGGRKCCGKDAKGANAVESQMKTDKPATTTESIEVDDAKYQGGGGGYGGGGGGYGGGGHGGGWGGGGGRKCCGKNAKESQMKNDKPDVAEPDQGGGGGRGGGGGGGGGGGRCRYGCCGWGNYGCYKCCYSTKEAAAFISNEAEP